MNAKREKQMTERGNKLISDHALVAQESRILNQTEQNKQNARRLKMQLARENQNLNDMYS